jgi:hypothetical protein
MRVLLNPANESICYLQIERVIAITSSLTEGLLDRDMLSPKSALCFVVTVPDQDGNQSLGSIFEISYREDSERYAR